MKFGIIKADKQFNLKIQFGTHKTQLEQQVIQYLGIDADAQETTVAAEKINEFIHFFRQQTNNQHGKLPPVLAQFENPHLDNGLLFLDKKEQLKQSAINRLIIVNRLKERVKELDQLLERESGEAKAAVFRFLIDVMERPETRQHTYQLHRLDAFPTDTSNYRSSYILVGTNLHFVDSSGVPFHRVEINNLDALEAYLAELKQPLQLTEEQFNDLIVANGGKVQRGLAAESAPQDVVRKYFRNYQDAPSFYQIVGELKNDTNIATRRGGKAKNSAILDEQRKLIPSAQTASSQLLDELAREFPNTLLQAPPKPAGGLYSEHLSSHAQAQAQKQNLQERSKDTSEKRRIEDIVIVGDSLSDEWEMYNNVLMGAWSGIQGVSPHESFTNGYSWSDLLHKKIAKDSIKAAVKQKFPELTDPQIKAYAKMIRKKFLNLDQNSTEFKLFDTLLSRIYAIGGLTAANVNGTIADDFVHTLVRLALSNLEEKNAIMKKADDAAGRTAEQKANTLIIEWSGANDIITINAKPQERDIEAAVEAKLNNLEKWLDQGYRNFVLPNIPDLAIVPRFRRLPVEEQKRASDCANKFNQLLLEGCEKLQTRKNREIEARNKHLALKGEPLESTCSIEVFDINAKHKKYMQNPDKYGFSTKYQLTPTANEAEFLEKVSEANGNPKGFDAMKLYYFLKDNNETGRQEIHYLAKDPCGQIQRDTITEADLLEAMKVNRLKEEIKKEVKKEKPTLSDPQCQQEVDKRLATSRGEYEAKYKDALQFNKMDIHFDTDSLKKYHRLILDITNARGDTIDDVFTPIKDTKAFVRYQQNLAAKGWDMHILSSKTLVSYDDVHPSDLVFKLLYKNDLSTFIKKKYEVVPKALTIPQEVIDQLPNPGSLAHAAEPQPAEQDDLADINEIQDAPQPEEALVQQFVDAYQARIAKDRNSFFGDKGAARFHLSHQQGELPTVHSILRHAAKDGYWNRTLDVIRAMGWVKEGNISEEIKPYLPAEMQELSFNDIKEQFRVQAMAPLNTLGNL